MDPVDLDALAESGALLPDPAPGLALGPTTQVGSQQTFLPIVWPLPESVRAGSFAHPAEADLAALLDRAGVRWAYEPTSFALEYGADGRPSEMFTPDFYLPDERNYLELTTMRQRLVTRKNRKLRLLRELYPDIRIKLLYRRDYQQLIDCHLDQPPVGFAPHLAGIVADADAITARLREIAADIAVDELAAQIAPPKGGSVSMGTAKATEIMPITTGARVGSRSVTSHPSAVIAIQLPTFEITIPNQSRRKFRDCSAANPFLGGALFAAGRFDGVLGDVVVVMRGWYHRQRHRYASSASHVIERNSGSAEYSRRKRRP